MANFNKVILLGNLTRDPDMRFSQTGTAIANFGLAVNRGEEVCFIDIVTFGRQAETVGEYLAKGQLVMVEGRLNWRSWETDDGQRRSKHEVVANTVQFMPRGSGMPTGESVRPLMPRVQRRLMSHTPETSRTFHSNSVTV